LFVVEDKRGAKRNSEINDFVLLFHEKAFLVLSITLSSSHDVLLAGAVNFLISDPRGCCCGISRLRVHLSSGEGDDVDGKKVFRG
jgi:hypothetical protein